MKDWAERNNDIFRRYSSGESMSKLAREYNVSRQRISRICYKAMQSKLRANEYPYRELIKIGASQQIIQNVCAVFKNEGISKKEDLASLSMEDIMQFEGAQYKTRSFSFINILYIDAIKECAAK